MSHRELIIQIQGMGCGSCVAKVEKKLAALEGVEGKVDFSAKTAHVILSEGVAEETVVGAIQELGYQATVSK
jgi:copper chaperone CopZ